MTDIWKHHSQRALGRHLPRQWMKHQASVAGAGAASASASRVEMARSSAAESVTLVTDPDDLPHQISNHLIIGDLDWWPLAQLENRVHRIGQKRGVQAFKLVTSGTLEEKISAIIARKRNLMDSIVKEDDAGLLKTFSREELIELIDF